MIKKIDSETPLRARQVGELTIIPFYLVGGLAVGFWMGRWLDQKFGTEPYLLVVLMLLGLFAGARESWRIVREISATEDAKKK